MARRPGVERLVASVRPGSPARSKLAASGSLGMLLQSSGLGVSNSRRWGGIALSGLAVLFLVFDGVIKLADIGPVKESFAKLGYPEELALGVGVLELACVLVYILPITSVLGAVLLTGYLGGAVATHVRVQDPLFTHVLFPIYIGAMVWGGLLLREPRLGRLAPVRRSDT